MGQVAETEVNQVIETDDFGRLVIPAELLGAAKQGTRFVVKTAGTKLVVAREATEEQRQQASEEWERQWKVAQEQVSKVWPAGVSATDVISEMHR